MPDTVIAFWEQEGKIGRRTSAPLEWRYLHTNCRRCHHLLSHGVICPECVISADFGGLSLVKEFSGALTVTGEGGLSEYRGQESS